MDSKGGHSSQLQAGPQLLACLYGKCERRWTLLRLLDPVPRVSLPLHEDLPPVSSYLPGIAKFSLRVFHPCALNWDQDLGSAD